MPSRKLSTIRSSGALGDSNGSSRRSTSALVCVDELIQLPLEPIEARIHTLKAPADAVSAVSSNRPIITVRKPSIAAARGEWRFRT
jgi:hypothetical protein